MSNNYQPNNWGFDSQPPPPGTAHQPPLPSGPPLSAYAPPPSPYGPPPPMYHFGSAQQGANGQLNFNLQKPGVPAYPRNAPTGPSARRQDGPGARNRRQEYDRRDPRRQGPRYQRTATADRPLLQFQRGATPEQLAGMNADEETERRFIHPDEVSDFSDEAEQLPESDVLPESADGEAEGQARTEHVTADSGDVSVETPTKPKWTNAELYTALPPPDVGQRKKRDIVKLIRKARVVSEKGKAGPTQVASNDDFISFDTDMAEPESFETQRVSNDPAMGASYLHAYDLNGRSSVVPNQPAMLRGGSTTLASADTSNGTLAASTSQPDTSVVEKLSEDRKRKRPLELEDMVKLKQPRLQPTSKRFGGGSILKDWRAESPDLNAVPWHIEVHNYAGHPGLRLHKEICDFYDFVRPRPFEEAMRADLLTRLQAAMLAFDATYTVQSFGSFAAGLYLPNADMDLVVVSQYFLETGIPRVAQSRNQMSKLARHLERSKIAQANSIEIIAGAKVPLIKFLDKTTSLRVDLSFENLSGVIANKTFHEWKAQFPAMPVIVTVIKQYLLMRGMNEVVSGGLGGFTVTCLVTSLLQNMPRVQTGELVPEQNLGEILLEFLDLYGNQFDIRRVVIRMDPPGYLEKYPMLGHGFIKKPDRLAVLDPNRDGNDISGGSGEVEHIFARFSRAREEILIAMRSKQRKSLLDFMLGGNYNNFLWQRRHLKLLHKMHFGAGPEHSEDSDHGKLAEHAEKPGRDRQTEHRERLEQFKNSQRPEQAERGRETEHGDRSGHGERLEYRGEPPQVMNRDSPIGKTATPTFATNAQVPVDISAPQEAIDSNAQRHTRARPNGIGHEEISGTKRCLLLSNVSSKTSERDLRDLFRKFEIVGISPSAFRPSSRTGAYGKESLDPFLVLLRDVNAAERATSISRGYVLHGKPLSMMIVDEAHFYERLEKANPKFAGTVSVSSMSEAVKASIIGKDVQAGTVPSRDTIPGNFQMKSSNTPQEIAQEFKQRCPEIAAWAGVGDELNTIARARICFSWSQRSVEDGTQVPSSERVVARRGSGTSEPAETASAQVLAKQRPEQGTTSLKEPGPLLDNPEKQRAQSFRLAHPDVYEVPMELSRTAFKTASDKITGLNATGDSTHLSFTDLLNHELSLESLNLQGSDKNRADAFRKTYQFVLNVPPALNKEEFKTASFALAIKTRKVPEDNPYSIKFENLLRYGTTMTLPRELPPTDVVRLRTRKDKWNKIHRDQHGPKGQKGPKGPNGLKTSVAGKGSGRTGHQGMMTGNPPTKPEPDLPMEDFRPSSGSRTHQGPPVPSQNGGAIKATSSDPIVLD